MFRLSLLRLFRLVYFKKGFQLFFSLGGEIISKSQAKVYYIDTINDQEQDFIKLFIMYNEIENSSENRIIINFSECKFLRQNAIAFLGGMINYFKEKGKEVILDSSTIVPKILTNLQQNGFSSMYIDDVKEWDGNSIPYREFTECSLDLNNYLRDKWLGKGWVNLSNQLAGDIIARVYELYANAIEHSGSELGCFTCGQHFAYYNELTLSLVDFGVGISKKVQDSFEEEINSTSSLEWAFKQGNSTVKNPCYPRGMGLSLLQSFLTLNGGALDIYCNDVHMKIKDGETSTKLMSESFSGTMINIRIMIDNSFYDYEQK